MIVYPEFFSIWTQNFEKTLLLYEKNTALKPLDLSGGFLMPEKR